MNATARSSLVLSLIERNGITHEEECGREERVSKHKKVEAVPKAEESSYECDDDAGRVLLQPTFGRMHTQM